MRVMIQKKNLILYFLILIASIVFASFYGGPVVYAFLYGMFFLGPVSVLYVYLNYRNLCIFQEIEVHKVTKGEEHQYRILIENEGILPIYEMKLGLYQDRCILYELEEGQIISLNSYEKIELTSGINCLYAGAYNIGIETVTFTAPFKIFSVKLEVPYSFRSIVSPRVTEIANSVLDLENLVNNTGFKSMKLYEDIPGNDMRAYQQGDAVSAINWKVSARFSELMVRVPERMEKRRISILMVAANVPRDEQDIEYLKKRDFFLEFVVSAAWHFGNQGVPAKIVYPSGKVVENIVDSYESFMDFYSKVADGIYYDSNKDVDGILKLAQDIRGNEHGMDTWIILKEDVDKREDFCTVC